MKGRDRKEVNPGAEPELLHLEVCLGKRSKGERGGTSEMKGESVLEAGLGGGGEEEEEMKRKKVLKGKRIGNSV